MKHFRSQSTLFNFCESIHLVFKKCSCGGIFTHSKGSKVFWTTLMMHKNRSLEIFGYIMDKFHMFYFIACFFRLVLLLKPGPHTCLTDFSYLCCKLRRVEWLSFLIIYRIIKFDCKN